MCMRGWFLLSRISPLLLSFRVVPPPAFGAGCRRRRSRKVCCAWRVLLARLGRLEGSELAERLV